MDSAFNRSYGVYDQSRGFGTASAAASASTSRLNSPSVAPQSKVFGVPKRPGDVQSSGTPNNGSITPGQLNGAPLNGSLNGGSSLNGSALAGSTAGAWPISRNSSVSNLASSDADASQQMKQQTQDPLNGFNAFADGGYGQSAADYAQAQQQHQQQQYEAYANSYNPQYAQYFGSSQFGAPQYGSSQYGYGGQYYGGGYMPYMQYGGYPQQSYGALGGSASGEPLRSSSIANSLSSVDGDASGLASGRSGSVAAAAAPAAAPATGTAATAPSGDTSLPDLSSAGSGWSAGNLGPNSVSHSTSTTPDVAEKAGAASAVQDSSSTGIVQPSDMQWCYIDLSGVEQGPFAGSLMNDWMAYLLDYTMLRRSQDTMYLSFGALGSVTNSAEPFVLKLPAKEWDSIISRAIEKTQQDQARVAQAAQATQAAQAAPGAAASAAPGSAAGTGAGATSGAAQAAAQAAAGAANAAPGGAGAPPSEALSNLNVKDASLEVLPSSSGRATPDTLVSPGTKKNGSKKESLPLSSQQEKHAASSAKATVQPFPQASAQPQQQQQSKILKAEPARAPATDPWKKPVRASPQVSIAELKQQELEKQQKKKASQASGASSPASSTTPNNSGPASTRRAGQQRHWLPLEEIQPVEPEKQPEPVTPTWGKKNIPPARSLADIQREQAMKAEKAKHSVANGASSSPAAAAASTGGPASASAGNASTTTPSSSVASSGPSSSTKPSSRADNAPVKVTTTTTTTTTTVPNAARINATSSPTKSRPQRSFPSVTQAANSAKPTDELIHWARVMFKDLSKGIDHMELLEVFLSLPSNASAKEFIAESIFGYSSTIDGRKFAADFLNRKKEAERAMPAGETWTDVLNRFNPQSAQEQDPTFKVVSKKRGPKIMRP